MTERAAPLEAAELWRMLCALAHFRPSPREAGDPAPESVSVHRASSGPACSLGEQPDAAFVHHRGGRVELHVPLAPGARALFDRYAPLCRPLLSEPRGDEARHRSGSFVVAHLGQSLDGRIAQPDGKPEAITGPEDMAHNHRMRALSEVVLVGAGTVCHDDPALTVRHVEGSNPIRVVVDPERRLTASYGIFQDGLAPTLLLCRVELCRAGERHGQAEVVGVPEGCTPRALVAALRARELRRIFIEGGGVTVSRFLAAGCLDRLQIAVSPLIMGQGRPGLDLERTLRLRAPMRRFELGPDVLFECCFDEA